ncbi:MAG TPA: hypothetical protein PKD80_15450 [Microthrixaceae bacterium]|nr:hypothetical protein [Microthrixaceae bacterium]HMT26041.1 hypothetical protein [Microthrixaceae bacterium]HMT60574.1 hypothetical protein [Microthrixaceae bacterium]
MQLTHFLWNHIGRRHQPRPLARIREGEVVRGVCEDNGVAGLHRNGLRMAADYPLFQPREDRGMAVYAAHGLRNPTMAPGRDPQLTVLLIGVGERTPDFDRERLRLIQNRDVLVQAESAPVARPFLHETEGDRAIPVEVPLRRWAEYLLDLFMHAFLVFNVEAVKGIYAGALRVPRGNPERVIEVVQPLHLVGIQQRDDDESISPNRLIKGWIYER